MNKIKIGGITDSTEFVLGFGLLNEAKTKYPSCFMYEFEDMTEKQYWRWLKRLNEENGWKHNCNFVAWYEYMYGGPKSLIGHLDLFIEFMSEEYKVTLKASNAALKRIAADFKKVKMEKLIDEAKRLAGTELRRITIVYENHPGVGLLSREILNHRFIPGPHGIELTLYNLLHLNENRTSLHDDLVSLPAGMGFRKVKAAKNLKHALKNCDLLIFMGSDTVHESDLMDDLKGEAVFWGRMGQLVNKYSRNPAELRVIFTCMRYPCFNATFFLEYATKLSADLVVAVTHHVALEPLLYISRATGVPLTNMMPQTAHVWGSPGISQLVDLGNTDLLYNVPKMPMTRFDLENKLADEIDWENGNPFENAEFEDDFTWRKLDYAMGDHGWPEGLKYTWFYVAQQKATIIQRQQRQPYVTPIRATIDILSAWYDNFVMKTPLTVGVYVSESIYGVPAGLVFSMPALIRNDDRRGWYPVKWCEECRETFNMDHRPRWTNEPDPMNDPSPECRTYDASVCKRLMCAERKVSKRTCRHHRNPDIFLPADPLLSLTDVIITVFRIFIEVKFHIITICTTIMPERVRYIYLNGVYNASQNSNAVKEKSAKKVRVSFLSNESPVAIDDDSSDLKPSSTRMLDRLALIDSSRAEQSGSPSLPNERQRLTRNFQDSRAEKVRKELREEERKWEKFLEEPINPKEMMKYMAHPIPTELTGIITGAVKMSDLDKQVEKMIKERHKLLEEEHEAVPEEEAGEITDDLPTYSEQGSGTIDTVLLQSRQFSATVASADMDDEEDSNEELNVPVSIPPRDDRKIVTREDRENAEEELRLQKLLDAISSDDVPIYKMMRFVFPESPNIPEDPNDPYWYLKNKDYVKHVTKTLGNTGYDESIGVLYRKEFDANRLASIEHYWNRVVPRQYGHVYFTPKELQRVEKLQNQKIDLNELLLPEKLVGHLSPKNKTFVPPTREMGENDNLYNLRMATHLRKFSDAALKDFMNRDAESVRLDSGVWAKIDDEATDRQPSVVAETDQLEMDPYEE